MTTLKNETIVYDDDCPMCRIYTGAFVGTQMLDNKGRVGWNEFQQQKPCRINNDRARHEIALFNRQTQEVTYGIDSLFRILAHRWPFFRPLFSPGPFRWMLRHFYSFISYNRKVIAPGKVFESKEACTPDFHMGYRWSYIIVTWIITSLFLGRYSSFLHPLLSDSNFTRELLICGGQVLWQAVFVVIVRRERTLHYLGNMMTISFAGALMLLPGLILHSFISNPHFFAGWFLLVVLIMFAEHIRRVRLLELPWTVTFSWVLYRLLVLNFIL